MAAASVAITGQVLGTPGAEKSFSGQIASGTAVMNIATANMASGPNTIGAPSGMTGVMITPPVGNTVALTLKGVTGDTGILIHKTLPTLICLDPAVGSICLTAASSTGLVEFSWF